MSIKNVRLFKFKHFLAEFTGQKTLASLIEPRQYYERNHRNKKHRLALFPFIFIPTLLAKSSEDDGDNSKPVSRRDRFNFIADVVEEVMPSVVKIELKPNRTGLFGGGGPVSNGSGFIISKDGVVLTNAHVVQGINSNLTVELHDGRSFRGKVLKINKLLDLAIVKIECDIALKAARLCDSSSIRTGEFVVALGNPLTLNNTVTSGIVSNPKRDGAELGLANELFYIQTDTIVTHGNSGGPLVNLDGEVIGINTMTATPGISFAIPSHYAIEFIKAETNDNNNEKITGSQKCKYIGMKMITLTPQIRDLFSLQPGTDIKIPEDVHTGSLVIAVAPGSPADMAGLKRGDVIVQANGFEVRKNSDLLKILDKTANLLLVVRRGTREFSAKLTAADFKN